MSYPTKYSTVNNVLDFLMEQMKAILIAPISKEEYVKAVSDQLMEWEQWIETSEKKCT